MTARRCPVDGCASVPGDGKFMCRPHWFGLPKPLRDEIWRTWKIVRDGYSRKDRSPEQRLADIRAYREATAAAERWWRQ